MQVKELLLGVVKEIKIKHKNGSETILSEFKNLITDSGLDFIGTGTVSSATQYCSVSSNSDAPLITDSSILDKVGATSAIGSVSNINSGGSPSWYYEIERVYTFTLGSVVGNISKLYIHSGLPTGTVFSSALIKDGSGDPTTISITADDQLFITWAFRKNISTSPVSGSISIEVDGSPTNYDYEILPANLGTSSIQYYFLGSNSVGAITNNLTAYESSVLGDVTGIPSGTSQQITLSLSGYSNGNFYRDFTASATVGQANFTTGIGSMVYASASGSGATICGYQISFSPKLPKDSDRSISLPFRLSWARA